jgi:hypothetical protein
MTGMFLTIVLMVSEASTLRRQIRDVIRDNEKHVFVIKKSALAEDASKL